MTSVEVTRTIDAPTSEVYRAFLDPEKLSRWFCPDEFEVTAVEVDERVGGRHRTEIVSADHGRHAFDAEIFELVPHERIVLSWRFEELDTPRRSEESLLTISLHPVGPDRTEVRLVHSRLTGAFAEDREGVHGGWTEALGHLASLYNTRR